MASVSLTVATFILLAIVVATAAVISLPLNPQAPFIEEVQSIQHEIQARTITIELKISRRCLKPTFWVRLSGTSLYLLDLLSEEANKLVYSYPPLVDDGTYFVEVMALLCSSFDPNDFAKTCLENFSQGKNVVTSPYSFQVSGNEAPKTSSALHPRWVLSDKRNATMLPTRYQKLGCMSEEPFHYCPSKPADLLQHDLYDWVDLPNCTKLLQEVLALSHQAEKNHIDIPKGGGVIRVCSIGDSHARLIAEHGNKLGLQHVQFVTIPAAFPSRFNITSLETNNCSYSVYGVGQWPASNQMKGHPYAHDEYREKVHRVVTLLQQYDHNQTQVFLRSENYNALAGHKIVCPPIDYRSPMVIDMYNKVLKNLSQELSVEFIDLNPIMGPMWDSALDWCHPVGKVGTAQSETVLLHMLRSSWRRKLGVKLYKV